MEVARLAMMWMQQGETVSTGNSVLLMVFIGIVALGSLIQMIAVIVMAIGAAKARKELLEIAAEVRAKSVPVIAKAEGMIAKGEVLIGKASEIMQDAAPKVKAVTANLVDTSEVVKRKAHEFEVTLSNVNQTVNEVNARTRAQVERLDGMVGSTLKATSDLGSSIHHGIRTPVREVIGIVNGLRAGLDVLVGKATQFGAYGRRSRNNDVEF